MVAVNSRFLYAEYGGIELFFKLGHAGDGMLFCFVLCGGSHISFHFILSFSLSLSFTGIHFKNCFFPFGEKKCWWLPSYVFRERNEMRERKYRFIYALATIFCYHFFFCFFYTIGRQPIIIIILNEWMMVVVVWGIFFFLTARTKKKVLPNIFLSLFIHVIQF